MNTFEKVKSVVTDAYKYSPFYSELYKNFDMSKIQSFEDFKQLPIISAEDIVINSDRFTPTVMKPYRITSSSGTLGQPKTVYRTKEDTKVSDDVLERLLRMAGVDELDTIFIGQPFDLAHFGYLVFDAAKKIGAMSIPVGISVSNERFISLLGCYQPSVICTSMSRLLVIIDMLKSMNINELTYVKKIILAGEALTQNGINAIENFFGTKPYNFYGSEETDGLGGDCHRHKGLHFFNDLFYLELLEMKGVTPTKPTNKIGEAVITSLYQQGTPLIRYRLGDIVEIEEKPCDCGAPYPLIHVLGRAKESINIFDGITIMAYQIENVIKKSIQGVLNYQIVASTLVPGLDELCIRIETDRHQENNKLTIQKLKEDLWNCSQDLLAAKNAGALRLRVEIDKNNIYVTKRGKTPKIIDLRVNAANNKNLLLEK